MGSGSCGRGLMGLATTGPVIRHSLSTAILSAWQERDRASICLSECKGFASWRLRGDEMLGESPASSSDCAISVEILMFAFVLHVQAIKTTGACH